MNSVLMTIQVRYVPRNVECRPFLIVTLKELLLGLALLNDIYIPN